MDGESETTREFIRKAISAVEGRRDSPYRPLLPFLEALFLAQHDGRKRVNLVPPELSAQLVKTKWGAGFPLLMRWDFPVDEGVAEHILAVMKDHVHPDSQPLLAAHRQLVAALAGYPSHRCEIWRSFLQHETDAWRRWIETSDAETGALLLWGRGCLRPSLEWTAARLLESFPLPASWQQGYCPICGSLPALLTLHGEGERSSYCSWCGAAWGIRRFQCPYCDNRYHESLGYLYLEQQPQYRVSYCSLCKRYFKVVDTRELLDEPYLPLEEWTTLHLDMLAEREGLLQPPSPAPTVYGGARRQ